MAHSTSRPIDDPKVVRSSGESANKKDSNYQQRRALDGRESQNSSAHRDEWFSNQAGQTDFYRPNPGSFRQMSDDHEGSHAPISARVAGSDSPPKHAKSGNKRGRYTSIACINCQKRKVKCSGEKPCLLCRSADLPCVYKRSRKPQNTEYVASVRRAKAVNEVPTTPAPTHDTLSDTGTISVLMNRIESLERDRDIFKSHIAMVRDIHDINANSTSFDPMDYDTTSPSCASDASLPISEAYHAGTGLVPSIVTLNQTVVTKAESLQDSETDGLVALAPLQWQHLVRGEIKNLTTLEKETRSMDVECLRASIGSFFDRLNPQYPCLNENEFRMLFEKFLINDTFGMGTGDWYQFAALINLIDAQVKILSHDRTDSGDAPGWEEFCRAESISNHLTWLGNGNIWTVQILLSKARYLLLIEKSDSAYEAVGQTTRLCFQLGLHNQASWVDCTPFQTDMRQRIFWSIVCFDRNLALNNGTPVFMRESDFKVDFPKSLDDQAMFPDKPLPEECPERSSGLFLTYTAKWGKLFLEIWDTMFGIHAQKPTSLEFVASIDARILYTIGQLPPHLQWQPNVHRLEGDSGVPHYVLRQTLMSHLRMNQLRQLIRQESMLTLKYNDRTAEDCVAISTSSIDAISALLNTNTYKSTDRWSSVLYLTGAVLPLVCIIVRKDNAPQTRANAIEAFRRAMSMLSGHAVNFGLARHTLRKLHKIIGSAMQAIRQLQGAEMPALNPEDFETEILAPQITDLFSSNHNLSDPTRDLLDKQNLQTSPLEMFSMAEFAEFGDSIDSCWLDNLLSNEQLLYASG